ncbi:condensation domain-containing protein [Dactylosporangium sp. NPDC005555]|uniref:condensation domain-containing protein n=1 Tax=Dactylosporangium sp. NPDC005555 TaxID=3154889 RepID=UPI0033AD43E4
MTELLDSSIGLTHGQRRFWTAEQALPGKVDNRMAFAATLSDVDIATVQAAFALVVHRHEVLRSRYHPDGTRQHIDPGEPGLTVLPAPTSSADPATVADDVLARWWSMPLDLSRDPPTHGWAVPLPSGQVLLCVGVHHIAFDGWSRSVFLHDFAHACRRLRLGVAPADAVAAVTPYGDFVRWENERLAAWRAAETPFWQGLLADPLPPVFDGVDAAEGERAEHVTALPPDSTAALRRPGAAAAFLTAAAGAVGQVLHRDAFHLETMSSGRFEPCFGNTVGCFVNHLVLPFDRDDGLRTVGRRLYQAFRHAHTPVGEIGAGLPRGIPATQVCIILNQRPGSLPGLQIVEVRVPRSSVPLVIEANPGPDGSWSLYAGYRTDAMSGTDARATLDAVVDRLARISGPLGPDR